MKQMKVMMICQIMMKVLLHSLPTMLITIQLLQVTVSSNIDEAIRSVLNILFFFEDKISQAQKRIKGFLYQLLP